MTPILSEAQSRKLLSLLEKALAGKCPSQRGGGYGVPINGPTPAVLPPKWLDELPLRVRNSQGTAAEVTLAQLRESGQDKIRTVAEGASGKTARESEAGISATFADAPERAGAPVPAGNPFPAPGIVNPGEAQYSLARILAGAPPGALTPASLTDTLTKAIRVARERSVDRQLYVIRRRPGPFAFLGGGDVDVETPIRNVYAPFIAGDRQVIWPVVLGDDAEPTNVQLKDVLYRPVGAMGGDGLPGHSRRPVATRRALSGMMHAHAPGRMSDLPDTIIFPESGIMAPAHAPSGSDVAGWSSYAGGGRAVPTGVAPGQFWDTEAPDFRREFARSAETPAMSGSGVREPKQPLESEGAVRQKVEATFASFLSDAIRELGSETTMGPELYRYADTVLTGFSGVVAANEVPDSGDGKWVVNTDRRGLPGSHWTSLLRLNGQAYFYDSFGRPASALFSAPWAQRAITVADDAEQLGEQELCGAASVAWLRVVEELGVEAALHV